MAKGLSKAEGRATSIYSCGDYPAQLMSCFGMNVHRDTDTVHPPRFCNPCYATVRRSTKAAEDRVPHKHSVVVFEWSRHTENCLVSLLQELMLCMNNVINIHRYANTLIVSQRVAGKTRTANRVVAGLQERLYYLS